MTCPILVRTTSGTNCSIALFIVICAFICGAEKWDDVEACGKAKERWLRKFLELPHGIPSHDTAGGSSAIHMVGAWAGKAGLTLGQRRVNEKSNEITATRM